MNMVQLANTDRRVRLAKWTERLRELSEPWSHFSLDEVFESLDERPDAGSSYEDSTPHGKLFW